MEIHRILFSYLVKVSSSGTDRTKIYENLFKANRPLAKEMIPNFDSLFYEPFYQLMRQQFLTNEMEKAHELKATIVASSYLSPSA